MSKQCKCAGTLEIIHAANDYAETVAAQLVEDWTGGCPELVDLAVDHIVARLIHVQVIAHDDGLGEGQRLLTAVEKTLRRASTRLPALLSTIIEEANKKGVKNASH